MPCPYDFCIATAKVNLPWQSYFCKTGILPVQGSVGSRHNRNTRFSISHFPFHICHLMKLDVFNGK